MKDKKNFGKQSDAIELAILNGLESYSREQEKKKQHTGVLRTPAAMEEAGVNYVFLTIYVITYNCVIGLLKD